MESNGLREERGFPGEEGVEFGKGALTLPSLPGLLAWLKDSTGGEGVGGKESLVELPAF